MLLALELAFNFLIDLYRPRFHKEEKSILESRLLAVFTDSGSIASNIAHALDYQFGFKVSETGFYRFMGRVLLPLLAVQLLTLYLLSCITLVESGHRGLRETMGSIETQKELGPGLYFKLPWPLAKIHVFPADRIQSIEVGQQPAGERVAELPHSEADAAAVTEAVNLWSDSSHNQEGMEEVRYIIPRNESDADVALSSKSFANVSMITVIVPIHYRLKKASEDGEAPLYKYLFKHADAPAQLYSLASEAVMGYLSRADYVDFLGEDRGRGASELARLIQAAADERDLGVEIVLVALESTHPPGEVSRSYEDVIAASFDKDAYVFEAGVQRNESLSKARIFEADTLAAAAAETAFIDYEGADGQAERLPMKVAFARERALRLSAQYDSYESQPRLYSLITYLEAVEESLAGIPKIIIDSSKADYNFRFDLKPKLRPELSAPALPAE
jgi:regulator of protease activity HflC (stomatin/prohibitin superfamily)